MALLSRTWSVYPSARGALKSAAIDVGSHTFKAVLLSDSYTPGVLGATQRSDVAAYALGTDQTVTLSNSGGTVSTASAVSWSGSLSPRYVAVYDDTHASDALVCLADFGGVNGPSNISLGAQTLFTFDELTVAGSGNDWLVEDWDYADAATMFLQQSHAEINWGGSVTIVEDLTAPWGSPYKVAKCPSSSGVDIYVENTPLSLTGPREFWMDAWCKTDTNWKSDWDNYTTSSNPDHKTFLWFDQRNNRHDLHFGVYEETGPPQTQVSIIYNESNLGTPPANNLDVQPTLATDLWDGTWHRLRLHCKMNNTSQSNGIYEVWLDGVKLHTDTAVVGPHVDSDRFTALAFCRNNNHIPTEASHWYWGKVDVYTTDPGW